MMTPTTKQLSINDFETYMCPDPSIPRTQSITYHHANYKKNQIEAIETYTSHDSSVPPNFYSIRHIQTTVDTKSVTASPNEHHMSCSHLTYSGRITPGVVTRRNVTYTASLTSSENFAPKKRKRRSSTRTTTVASVPYQLVALAAPFHARHMAALTLQK